VKYMVLGLVAALCFRLIFARRVLRRASLDRFLSDYNPPPTPKVERVDRTSFVSKCSRQTPRAERCQCTGRINDVRFSSGWQYSGWVSRRTRSAIRRGHRRDTFQCQLCF